MNKDLIEQANELLFKNGESFQIDEKMHFKSTGVRHPIPLTSHSPRTVESFVYENEENKYTMEIITSVEYGILRIIIQDYVESDNSYRSYITEAAHL